MARKSACGGRVRPHGLAVSAFKQSACPIYSRNEPKALSDSVHLECRKNLSRLRVTHICSTLQHQQLGLSEIPLRPVARSQNFNFRFCPRSCCIIYQTTFTMSDPPFKSVLIVGVTVYGRSDDSCSQYNCCATSSQIGKSSQRRLNASFLCLCGLDII